MLGSLVNPRLGGVAAFRQEPGVLTSRCSRNNRCAIIQRTDGPKMKLNPHMRQLKLGLEWCCPYGPS